MGLNHINYEGNRDIIALLAIGVNSTMTIQDLFRDSLSMDVNDLDQLRVESTPSARTTIDLMLHYLGSGPAQNHAPQEPTLEQIAAQFDSSNSSSLF
ncbi:hypothetical protein BLNAU_17528 [Blattamonas nauphoetae]|uniref:Uncharacterized protein n=1 Tax=Blattamonas nauphoetae TaxID=2049346 RepID=A0ABQ9XBA1_9EUKA|nr:hypothetical protein BLNAU_17528 [Blattamonas nauphoetae]